MGMKIPFRKDFSFHSPLAIDDIQARLRDWIQPLNAPRQGIFSTDSSKWYEGTFTSSDFSFNRVSHSARNFTPPLIKGTLKSVEDGTEVHVTIRFHDGYELALSLVGIITLLYTLCLLLGQLMGYSFHLPLLAPLALAAIFFIFSWAIYSYEVREAILDFDKIFGAGSTTQ